MRRTVATKGYQPTSEERSFMVRRLLPFISPDVGVYPIEHLLMEAYMQGMRDTSDAIERRAARDAGPMKASARVGESGS